MAQCKGITKRGKQCSKKALKDSEYCRIHNTHKLDIRGVCVILFFISLISLIVFSLYADPGLLEFNKYLFGIDVRAESNEIQLQDFQIYYDFETCEGKINFYMTGTNATDYLVFHLPKEVKVKYLAWSAGDSRFNEGLSIYSNNTDYITTNNLSSHEPVHLIFSVENLDKSKKDYWSTVELGFSGKLYPNAEFRLEKDVGRIIPPKGTENGAFIKFNLGDKYQCVQPICYESFRKDELEFHYRDNKLTVSTKKEDQGWRDVDYPIFNLNYNRENNETFILFRDLSLNVLLLTLLHTLEFALKEYDKNKRKRANKKNKTG